MISTPISSFCRYAPLLLATVAWPAAAADLGPREWPLSGRHECVVIPAVTTPAGQEFLAVFARNWCQQGWAANSQLLLRESVPERWITRVDILRNDEPVLSVPMSPYVGKNLDQVAAAAVARIAAMLLRTDEDLSVDAHPGVAGNQPGEERK